ncbi:MAG: hypothetical protein GC200_10610 [Tepidisphaera sp.]|nr:hypothetical protein [Tepidisphaera sp.]
MRYCSLLALALFGAAATSAMADVVIANGGFENAGATAADAEFWNANFIPTPGSDARRNFGNAATGGFCGYMVAVGNDLAGSAAGFTQNSAAQAIGSLQPGSSVSMTFSGNYTFGPGGVGFYALRILNSAGAIVADTTLQGIFSNTNGYQQFTSPTLNVPAAGVFPNDAFYAFVEFDVNAGAFNGSTAQAYIDDVNVQGTLVPAPATLALFGGLALAGRRRR